MKTAVLNFLTNLQSLAMDENGQDLVEYALITGLLAVAAVAVLGNLATSITAIFTSINSTLTGA